jgi:hypothetical protein
MRTARFFIGLFAAALLISAPAVTQEARKPKQVTVMGKLTRVMAIGGESTGWSLELNRQISLEGKKMRSIEVSGPTEEFQKLSDKRVRARGTLSHRTGVERADHLVLEVSSIRPIK